MDKNREKGIVLEINKKNKQIIVLTPGCCYQRLPLTFPEPEVGEEIDFSPAAVKPHGSLLPAFSAVAAAVLLLAAGLVYLWSLFTTPAFYLALDINPAVELHLNRYERIIKAEPLNEAGSSFSGDVSLGFLKAHEGLGRLFQAAMEQKLINATDNNVIMISCVPAAHYSGKAEYDLKQYENTLTDILNNAGVPYLLIANEADTNIREAAQSEGISVNRMLLLKAAEESGMGYSAADIKGKRMAELLHEIEEKRGELPKELKGNKNPGPHDMRNDNVTGAAGESDLVPGDAPDQPGKPESPPEKPVLPDTPELRPRPDEPPGRPESPGDESDETPGLPETPGRSDEAPGRPDDTPDRPESPGDESDETPGPPETPGRSDEAPGRPDEPPGQTDESPGRSDEAPGRR